MDDGSVIDEEEEEEEEEEIEIFDDNNYLRMPNERDQEDMELLPSYQHYIDTIDTMIFGNRLSVPGHHYDDQGFITLATPAPTNGR